MALVQALERRYRHTFLAGDIEVGLECTEKEYSDLAARGTPVHPSGLVWLYSGDFTVYDTPDGKIRDQDVLDHGDGTVTVLENMIPVLITSDYDVRVTPQGLKIGKPHPDLRKAQVEARGG